MGKNKNEDNTFMKKKYYHDEICRWNRDSVSSEVKNYKGNRLNKDIEKEYFEKDLMNLNEKNRPINKTLDHSISRTTRLKAIWILRVWTCFQHCSSCAKHSDFASVSVARTMWTYKGDMNSASEENKNKPSPSTI